MTHCLSIRLAVKGFSSMFVVGIELKKITLTMFVRRSIRGQFIDNKTVEI